MGNKTKDTLNEKEEERKPEKLFAFGEVSRGRETSLSQSHMGKKGEKLDTVSVREVKDGVVITWDNTENMIHGKRKKGPRSREKWRSILSCAKHKNCL